MEGEEREANNYVLRYAVMRQITCPRCDEVMDVRDSTLLLQNENTMVLHTRCLPSCFEPKEETEVITWQA